MTYKPEIHHRRSIRLKEYDYSRSGAYFVTVCAWKKENIFGEISKGKVNCNEAGKIVTDSWCMLLDRFPSIELDEFVIMPNHIHGIVVLNAIVGVGLALPGMKQSSGLRIRASKTQTTFPNPVFWPARSLMTSKQPLNSSG